MAPIVLALDLWLLASGPGQCNSFRITYSDPTWTANVLVIGYSFQRERSSTVNKEKYDETSTDPVLVVYVNAAAACSG